MSASPRLPATLAVSVVVFHPDPAWLKTTLASLEAALIDARQRGGLSRATIMLVDNAATSGSSIWALPLNDRFEPHRTWTRVEVLAGHGNCGYGAGNNLAFARAADAEYLLALNPDVELDREAITQALNYLACNTDTAMVTPIATDAAGAPLFLVKNYPQVLTLAIRGFAPEFVGRIFRQRLATYERRDRSYNSTLSDVRIASGCFMFMRASAFARVAGFDPAFFLYFEDFDLSYRLSAFATVVRLPACRIVHGGGNASGKGWKQIGMFARSAWHFFHKHGWKW